MDTSSATTKVLLVDDDADDHIILRTLLSKVPGNSFELEWVKDPQEATAVIRAARHDIYLVDYRLGVENGLELLSRLDIQDRPEPFIILTGAGDRRIEQRAMDMGVADYLVKGRFDAELLGRVLRYCLQRKHLEAQRLQHLMEINRSKDEFISLASHQLRTPATVVKQYIAMVLGGYVGDVPEAQRSMLSRAYESNELQLRIVNDLLHVAALDAGRVRLQKARFDLAKLAASAVHDQQSKFQERRQTIDMDLPEGGAKVIADELKLRMVFDNLLDNASKYSDHGTHIRVRVRVAGTMVRVEVTDQGVGISDDNLGKLFQKFSRIDNRLSTEVGGSGLGLYWAKQIVDLHNGTLAVRSVADDGTTFTVKLPRAGAGRQQSSAHAEDRTPAQKNK